MDQDSDTWFSASRRAISSAVSTGACRISCGGAGAALLSRSTRQRRQSDEGRFIYLQRLHFLQDSRRKIHYIRVGDWLRTFAGTGRPFPADRGGRGFDGGSPSQYVEATAAALCARRRGGRPGCCL